MRRNLAPSQRLPSNAQGIQVVYPQGFIPPARKQEPISNTVFTPTPKQSQTGHSPSPTNFEEQDTDTENTRYFNAVWCKQSTRKHKKWEGDALLIIKASERLAILRDADSDGKEIGRGSSLPISKLSGIENGSSLSFGGKEIEIMDEINAKQYKTAIIGCKQRGLEAKKAEEDQKIRDMAEAKGIGSQVQFSNDNCTQPSNVSESKKFNSPKFKPFIAPTLINDTCSINDATATMNIRNETKAIFDATHPDAIVMPRPSQWRRSSSQNDNDNAMDDSGNDIIDVVVDPHLGRQLRPHQVEGLLFLYKCVMGYQVDGSYGAILADEMGLGKTLQTIALIWTLLKQSPTGSRKSIIKNTLILAPSSLVKNWEAEFNKWLGRERIAVSGIDGSASLTQYIKCPLRARAPVLILSYEMFTRAFSSIEDNLSFDLLVCDEGHRLKNSAAKASQYLASMASTDKRIVLTGTPLQNELKEFFAIVNVVCPGILGTASHFTRQFEEPILRSKQPHASDSDIENGHERMEELTQLTGQFILRRTQDIISKYLPSKTEYVLFCPMSALQAYIFQQLVNDTFGQSTSMSSFPNEIDWDRIPSIDSKCILATINQFRKICNHPSFMETESDAYSPENLPSELANLTYEEQGSKLAVVSCILHALRQQGGKGEKIVLVSISTKVLDLLGELCEHYNYPTLRLDGSTNTTARERLVARFNSPYTDSDDVFVLLLSSKAGGTGLNLIGASRILLFDMDWNPAHDLQAMARVWRDGQKRKVHVYRLATAGSIEEKIFQRQVTKQGLGGGVLTETVADGSVQKNHFTSDELKDLFSFDHDAKCNTHELINCECKGDGSNIAASEVDIPQHTPSNEKRVEMQDLMRWKHIDPTNTLNGQNSLHADPILQGSLPYLSYVFQNEVNASAKAT